MGTRGVGSRALAAEAPGRRGKPSGGGRHGTDDTDANPSADRRGLQGGRPSWCSRRAARRAPGRGVITPHAPRPAEARRPRRRSRNVRAGRVRGSGQSRRSRVSSSLWVEARAEAANRDRRWRNRRPERGAHAQRRGALLDGLRSVESRRWSHAFGYLRLLAERPGQRVVRRADRQRARDDHGSRQPLQPAPRRSHRRRAAELDRHLLLQPALLLRHAGNT